MRQIHGVTLRFGKAMGPDNAAALVAKLLDKYRAASRFHELAGERLAVCGRFHAAKPIRLLEKIAAGHPTQLSLTKGVAELAVAAFRVIQVKGQVSHEAAAAVTDLISMVVLNRSYDDRALSLIADDVSGLPLKQAAGCLADYLVNELIETASAQDLAVILANKNAYSWAPLETWAEIQSAIDSPDRLSEILTGFVAAAKAPVFVERFFLNYSGWAEREKQPLFSDLLLIKPRQEGIDQVVASAAIESAMIFVQLWSETLTAEEKTALYETKRDYVVAQAGTAWESMASWWGKLPDMIREDLFETQGFRNLLANLAMREWGIAVSRAGEIDEDEADIQFSPALCSAWKAINKEEKVQIVSILRQANNRHGEIVNLLQGNFFGNPVWLDLLGG